MYILYGSANNLATSLAGPNLNQKVNWYAEINQQQEIPIPRVVISILVLCTLSHTFIPSSGHVRTMKHSTSTSQSITHLSLLYTSGNDSSQ